jgi:hypothetical protein
MTSETFVFGGPVSEKVAIGARVRRYAQRLGAGHVEAAVENYGDCLRVVDARAFPLTALDYGIQRQLESHLNGPEVKP